MTIGRIIRFIYRSRGMTDGRVLRFYQFFQIHRRHSYAMFVRSVVHNRFSAIVASRVITIFVDISDRPFDIVKYYLYNDEGKKNKKNRNHGYYSGIMDLKF